MTVELNVKDGSAFFSQNLSLLSQALTVKLKYNSTDKKWRLDISNNDGDIIKGRLLSVNTSPTKKYNIDVLRGGNFWVFKKTNTDQPLGFDNLGFNKDYGLFFLTTADEAEYGL